MSILTKVIARTSLRLQILAAEAAHDATHKMMDRATREYEVGMANAGADPARRAEAATRYTSRYNDINKTHTSAVRLLELLDERLAGTR